MNNRTKIELGFNEPVLIEKRFKSNCNYCGKPITVIREGTTCVDCVMEGKGSW